MVLSADYPKPVRMRIIPFGYFTGLENMALDNYFSQTATSSSDIVMRFYGWDPYCVSIGVHQSSDILDLKTIANNRYDVVRRPTGGRAIFHARELTYSIVAPKSRYHHNELYQFSHRIIAGALQDLGYAVGLTSGMEKLPKIEQTATDYPCFTRSAESEIQFSGRKVVGSAQKICKNSILQHGSILIDADHKKLTSFLIGSPGEIATVDLELQQKTISLNEINKTEITSEKIIGTVVKQLESLSQISVYFSNLTRSEREYSRSYEIPL